MKLLHLRNWRQSLNTSYRVKKSLKYCLGLYRKASTVDNSIRPYDSTYPITRPLKISTKISYKIGLIGDFDKDSKDPTEPYTWFSSFKQGNFFLNSKDNSASVLWNKYETIFTCHFSMKGRGMELSELVTFDKRLLTFCDITGLVYHVHEDYLHPWIILTMGSGKKLNGMKVEWATVKDQKLYVGSIGIELITQDECIPNTDFMWIYIISPTGEKKRLDWSNNYNLLRKAIDIEFPGYIVHESVVWSNVHQKWFFLPRKCTNDHYDPITDEMKVCDKLLSADEHFTTISVTTIPGLNTVRGFASFKFLPESDDSIIVALKTEEYQDRTATYITAFTLDGRILMPDEKVTDRKFEGIEFI